jgi:phosphohistidine phosphatase
MSDTSPRLLLLRHADAGDPNAWAGPDAERPLSDKGVDQSERMGALLATRDLRPAHIRSSPKVRAVQTAEIVADALGLSVDVEDWLAGDYDLIDLADRLVPSDGEPDILVGHDPAMSSVLSEMLGRQATLRKGELASLTWAGELRAGAVELIEQVRPK